MSTVYSYNIETDFPNHRVNISTLELEIQSSTITVALSDDKISTNGTECLISFKTTLTSSKKLVLDSIVANHQGVETIVDYNSLTFDEIKPWLIDKINGGNSNLWYIGDGITKPYKVFIAVGNETLYCIISLDDLTSKADFENNFKAKCSRLNISTIGKANFDGKIYYRKGFRHDCPAGETTNIDITFDTDVLLFGGDYKVIGTPNDADILNVVLGVNTPGGFYPVITIAEEIYVSDFPSGMLQNNSTAKDFPVGLVMRVQYVNTGLVATKLGFLVEAWR